LQLRDGEEILIRVSPITKNHNTIGWYWYGLGENTYDKPVTTKEEAGKEASDFYKKSLKNK
jgi:hypothetical protein